jgi:hypothetical protein
VNKTARTARLGVTLIMALGLSACAGVLRSARIADVRDNPGRYQNRSVDIEGTVTTSWGVPLVPFRLYRVDDGTGEVTVLSQSSRTPTRGARVKVRGRVEDVGVLGGQALGLHVREQQLQVKRY